MKRRIVFALFILLVLMLLTGCSAEANQASMLGMTQTGGIPADGEIIFQDPFVAPPQPEIWSVSVDGNVGCSEFPASPDDGYFGYVELPSPSGDDNIAVVIANKKHEPGLFANVIAHQEIDLDLEEPATYILSGYMAPHPAPYPESKIEVMNPSIEITVDGVAHYGEVLWYINPGLTKELAVENNKHYWGGVIYGRRGPAENDAINLHIPDYNYTYAASEFSEDKFLYFEIQISVDVSKNYYVVDRLQIDDFEYIANYRMWEEEKGWGYGTSTFQIFLETHNQFTNCDAANNFTGASFWDDIKLVRYPFNQVPDQLEP